MDAILSWGGCIMAGVAIGHHFGIIDGIAAFLVVYALIPYRPS